MSERCDREACVLRLERIAASARILAGQLKSGKLWYQDALEGARALHGDTEYVLHRVADDKTWEAGDR